MFKSYKTKRDTLIEKAKEKLEVNKNYENKKKKEMDFIKGKNAEEALKFTLKAVNDDINSYNNQVLNLLRIGMKKSQFSKFKVPKPKYNCKARDLKSISQYDPKSYYYSMDVVLRCTFDNLQYAGGTGKGGEIPLIDPDLLLNAINAALGTRAQTDITRTLDMYLEDLRIMQNIINEQRNKLNEVRNKYTSFKDPVPGDEEKELPELELDPEKKGIIIGNKTYQPKKILQKLFLSKKFLDENPFGLSEKVIDKLRQYSSDKNITSFPTKMMRGYDERNVKSVERFINEILTITVDVDPDYVNRVNDYIKAYKQRFNKNPTTLNLTTFMTNYIKILLGISLPDITGANRDEQEWIIDYMKNVVKINIPKGYAVLVRDLFLKFLIETFPDLKDEIKKNMTVPTVDKQDELLKKPDEMTDEQKLEYANMLFTEKLNKEGVKDMTNKMKEDLINSVINLIIIANKAGGNVTDKFLKDLKLFIDGIDLQDKVEKINYFKSDDFKIVSTIF
jgi:hypothetical protein